MSLEELFRRVSQNFQKYSRKRESHICISSGSLSCTYKENINPFLHKLQICLEVESHFFFQNAAQFGAEAAHVCKIKVKYPASV